MTPFTQHAPMIAVITLDFKALRAYALSHVSLFGTSFIDFPSIYFATSFFLSICSFSSSSYYYYLSRTFKLRSLNQNSLTINASPADLSYSLYDIVVVFASWPGRDENWRSVSLFTFDDKLQIMASEIDHHLELIPRFICPI